MDLALSQEEEQIVRKIELYFKSGDMTFRDKVFNALLIAQYDLEAQHFSNERQHARLTRFKTVLDSLWQKLN
ncbi:MAG: hypothetical protein ABFD08_11945 [Syntrophomonas sp.]